MTCNCSDCTDLSLGITKMSFAYIYFFAVMLEGLDRYAHMKVKQMVG